MVMDNAIPCKVNTIYSVNIFAYSDFCVVRELNALICDISTYKKADSHEKKVHHCNIFSITGTS